MSDKYESLVLSAKKERKKLLEAKKEADSKFAPGDYFCLISAKWWQSWEAYTTESGSTRPPEIDNTELVLSSKGAWTEPHTVLVKPDLQENYDYVLVSAAEYALLKKWYNGGPKIERKVVKDKNDKKGKIEVYLLHLKIVLANKQGEPSSKGHHTKEFYISRDIQIDSFTNVILRVRLCSRNLLMSQEFSSYISSPVRLWCYQADHSATLLETASHTLAEEGLIPGETILVESRKDGRWPRDGKPKKNIINMTLGFLRVNKPGAITQEIAPLSSYPKGVCGLDNLGNTCFMNSSLQCLNNTALFSEYFLSNKYQGDVNRSNPLGNKGNLAEAYASLCKSLWSGNTASVAPRTFKSVIAKFAPQFDGYQQHDSQELTGYLLDGLHEDLNKITKKPFFETPCADGRTDEEVATEAWKGHLSRNRSVVVDLFQGQLKSKVQCPDCEKVSVTFDPFMILPLPLQEQTKRTIEASLILLSENHKNPILHAFEVPANGSIKDLRRTIVMAADLTEEQGDNLKIADIVSSKIYKFYGDKNGIDTISPRDTTFIYEIPRTGRYIRMLQRRKRIDYHYSKKEIIGLPMIISFGSYDISAQELYQQIWDMVKRLCEGEGDPAYSVDSNRSEDPDENPSSNNKTKNKYKLPGPQLDFKKDLPFRVCLTNSSGTSCSFCDDTACTGCVVKTMTKELPFLRDPDHYTVTVHWKKWAQHHFYDLNEAKSVTVHQSIRISRSKKNEDSGVNLFDCLRMFSSGEQLGPNDMWYCPRCKDHKQAYKKMEIYNLPKILILQLKRFEFSRTSHTKITKKVDFPLTGLDISEYVINENQQKAVYELFAVSNHMGSLAGGHYTAYCKNKNDSKWYHFNDSSVHPIKPDGVVSDNAYVLYYQQITPPTFCKRMNAVEGKEKNESENKPPSNP